MRGVPMTLEGEANKESRIVWLVEAQHEEFRKQN